MKNHFKPVFLVVGAISLAIVAGAFVRNEWEDRNKTLDPVNDSHKTFSPGELTPASTVVVAGQQLSAKHDVPKSSTSTPTKIIFVSQVAAEVGYGAFVSNALASNDPKAKFDAVKLLRECKKIGAKVERDREIINQDVGPGKSNAAFTYALGKDEQIQRHCQSITQEQTTQYAALLESAARGAAPGAAFEYYMSIEPSTAVQQPWLAETLQNDANQGDVTAMYALACKRIGDRLSAGQRTTYLEAVRTVAKANNGASIRAAAVVEYCSVVPNAGAVVDAEMVQRLAAKAIEFDNQMSY